MRQELPQTGFLRLADVLHFIPVSRSTWWAGVRSGRYPQPTRALGARITAWAAADIRRLIDESTIATARVRPRSPRSRAG
ncbi:MAG TPA: AlpA family phage regulatory protein [Lysobacter sp.]